MSKPAEIRVCMDIGSQRHQIAIGLSTGEIIDEFSMTHTPKDIEKLFRKIEDYKQHHNLHVVVAMEGFNGYARPIDKYVLSIGDTLLKRK